MSVTSQQVFNVICYVMRCDPDIMAQSPRRDRGGVVAEAGLLAFVAVVSGIAWTNFWRLFISLPVALFFGGIAFAFIVLMDSAIGACDWRLEGVLRRPGTRYRLDWWCRLGLRIGVSVVLSYVTSEGATQALFHEAIAVQLERDVLARNHATEDRFAKREDDLRQQRLGTVLREIDRLNAVLKETTAPLDKAQELQATAQNHLDTAEREVDRQRRGLDGYPPGCGPKCKVAIIDADTARVELAKATAQVGIYKPRFVETTDKLAAAKTALAVGEQSIQGDLAALESEKRLQLVSVRNDPLLSHTALQEIFDDPVTGPQARHYSWRMMTLLLTVELSYLMVRILFAHASVYTVLVIKDAKLRAERAEAEYRRESDALRTWSGGSSPTLPPVKLISWDDPAAKPSNDDEDCKRRRDPPDDDLEAAE